MGPVEKCLLLISLTVAFAPLAQRLHVAEPITFLIGGLLVSLIPRFPGVQLDPDLVSLLVGSQEIGGKTHLAGRGFEAGKQKQMDLFSRLSKWPDFNPLHGLTSARRKFIAHCSRET